MARTHAQRLVVSAFVVVHLLAVGFWNLPACALKEKAGAWPGYYLLPTGQWQQWGMFAPDPATATFSLEAMARDARGLIHAHPFPRVMDRSVWEGVWGYRHSKYLNNMGMPTAFANREFAARYVVRALKLKPEDFPVDVQLVYEVRVTNAPDAPDDPPASPTRTVLETYRFPNLAEALP